MGEPLQAGALFFGFDQVAIVLVLRNHGNALEDLAAIRGRSVFDQVDAGLIARRQNLQDAIRAEVLIHGERFGAGALGLRAGSPALQAPVTFEASAIDAGTISWPLSQ